MSSWEAPGAPDEDTQKAVLEGLTQAGGFLLGRRTYEILGAY